MGGEGESAIANGVAKSVWPGKRNPRTVERNVRCALSADRVKAEAAGGGGRGKDQNGRGEARAVGGKKKFSVQHKERAGKKIFLVGQVTRV